MSGFVIYLHTRLLWCFVICYYCFSGWWIKFVLYLQDTNDRTAALSLLCNGWRLTTLDQVR